eukprot:CAMPEP_0206214762 /NCGR_PEP_ID=MMETSP0047_2-20121206/1838_1 /ASSEMBLY_ACC=CAM_ASM_000192 /TAXON_ID=195065 /ORGANISM="Chroomonas mesostigmatica_cf, Strain CCMP1168" /LENGTH=69 /DNA_ID=CAMNT_0053637019 /DNA_START=131 /DNA_END=340 /DNA_ORIENTATION=+
MVHAVPDNLWPCLPLDLHSSSTIAEHVVAVELPSSAVSEERSVAAAAEDGVVQHFGLGSTLHAQALTLV